MAAALRRLGFDKVFDTDFAADLTIMEEANELVERIKEGGTLPMITSCSPGWVNYCELYYPELLPHLSSCKSPQQMFGAIAKTGTPSGKALTRRTWWWFPSCPVRRKSSRWAAPTSRRRAYRMWISL